VCFWVSISMLCHAPVCALCMPPPAGRCRRWCARLPSVPRLQASMRMPMMCVPTYLCCALYVHPACRQMQALVREAVRGAARCAVVPLTLAHVHPHRSYCCAVPALGADERILYNISKQWNTLVSPPPQHFCACRQTQARVRKAAQCTAYPGIFAHAHCACALCVHPPAGRCRRWCARLCSTGCYVGTC
jgi:hypothetical protein